MVNKLSYLSDAHHFAIANVAVQSAYLDHTIEHMIRWISKEDDDLNRFFLKSLNQNRIVELLHIMLIARLPYKEAELDKLFSRITKCRSARHEIIHWSSGPFGRRMVRGKVVFFDARPYREADPKLMTARDIQKIADSAVKYAGELVLWMNLYNLVRGGASLGKLSLISPRPSWFAFAKRHWPSKAQVQAHQRRSSLV